MHRVAPGGGLCEHPPVGARQIGYTFHDPWRGLLHLPPQLLQRRLVPRLGFVGKPLQRTEAVAAQAAYAMPDRRQEREGAARPAEEGNRPDCPDDSGRGTLTGGPDPLREESSPYEDLKTLQQAIEAKPADLDPDLPLLPEPETVPDDEGWLFDSRRDYMEQLRYYKNR